MTIDIISVGKIKEPFVLDGIAHYHKYLKPFTTLSFLHVTPAKIPKKPSQGDINQVKQKEAQAIRKQKKKGYTIALSPEGKTVTSHTFARLIKDIGIYHDSTITFIIGGSYGIDEGFKRECDLIISMSRLTFPHQLSALILSEQLFRAFKINNNEPYHK